MAGVSQESCVGRLEDPLVADGTSLLVGGKTLALPPPPKLGLLLLNFPNFNRVSHPAFRIL